jgi:peptidoglycan/LPS O-acetylase OafA/YrhL
MNPTMQTTAPLQSQAAPPPPQARLPWVDNLRTFIILLVVNMHACVTYSHVGSWYIMEPDEPAMPLKIGFLFWQGHLQSFFMGLLFFISGVFSNSSLNRRGATGFIRERLLRLGAPALLYMLLLHPFMVLWMIRKPNYPTFTDLVSKYKSYIFTGRVLSGNGPLWFALALLLFCIGLVLWRKFRSPHPANNDSLPPTTSKLILFGVVLVLSTFLVRTVQPIGKDFFNFQLCFFAQYIAAFAAGVIAGREGWFDKLAQLKQTRSAGLLALIGGPMLLTIVMFLGGPLKGEPPSYAGGWNPQAFGLALWEQVTGFGLGLGSLYLFRRCFNYTNTVLKWAADRSFAVYVLHAPILVALSLYWLRPLHLHPIIGATVLTFVGLFLSYAVADLAKRLPGLRRIL